VDLPPTRMTSGFPVLDPVLITSISELLDQPCFRKYLERSRNHEFALSAPL